MEKAEFIPVLRFMAVSDIHIKDEPSVERERFAKAIQCAYKIAESSDTYKKLDALAIVGDFATSGSLAQMQAAKKIIDENLREGTQVIASIASHEYHTEGGAPIATARLKYVFGCEPDNHVVINGFHFVSESPSHGCNYNDEKKKWMSDNLKEAAADDRKKPIFVFQHPHNTGTVYGSILWGEDDLISIYMDYPQIIHFSGHSHAPINDPRSIHQKHFTSLGTGTLSYFELDEFDKRCGTIPENKEQAAQMLIVEVDAENRVRVYPYDVLTDNYFPYVWEIDTPSDPETFKYTNERYNRASFPCFEDGAEINVVSESEDGAEIEFPQAKSDDDPYVNSYTVSVRNTDGDIVRRFSVWSDYYLYNMPEIMKVKIDKLEAGKKYTVEVRAESFWHTVSAKAIKAEIHTK